MNPLKYKDKIALIAPSLNIGEEEIQKCVKKLKQIGLIGIPLNLGKTDNEKAEEFMRAFTEDEFNAVFCIRGGYGASRLIPLIDFSMIKPKIFLGYSDATAFHLAISRYCNFPTFHGPMPGIDLIRKSQISLLFRKIKSQNITGGNLSIVTSSLGTPYEVETSDKMLFIEEVNEPIYKIDRMITQLRHANKLNSEVVLGHFTSEEGKRIPKKIIEDIIGKKCRFFPSGHSYPNKTLVMS